MEHIKKAIERARQERHLSMESRPDAAAHGGINGAAMASNGVAGSGAPTSGAAPAQPAQIVALDRHHLQAMRIMAYDAAEVRTTHYDMLRTQVLQLMDAASCQTIAVTSPRLGCGKTVTAINLALSIARQSDRMVLLVDLDLRKPQVGRYLGLQPTMGIGDVLAGRCQPSEVIHVPDVCDRRLAVLATPGPVPGPTEHLVSSPMKIAVDRLKKDLGRRIIIFDLPPMLSSDDFLAFLPRVDCALLVASCGESTVQDIAECERLIDPEKFIGCVLNKVTEVDTGYHSYG